MKLMKSLNLIKFKVLLTLLLTPTLINCINIDVTFSRDSNILLYNNQLYMKVLNKENPNE